MASSRRASALGRRPAVAALQMAGSLLGTAPIALLASVALARLLPLDEEPRFVIGFALAIPLWIAAICLALVARSSRRVWLLSALSALVLIGVNCAAPLP
jgi:hypothetical protein